MKASELRIGNIVTVNNPEFMPQLKGIPFKVYSISPVMSIKGNEWTYSIGLISLNNNENIVLPLYSQFIEFLNPVRLTKEWLAKYNFTFKNSNICSPSKCWHEYEVFGNRMTDSIRMSLQSKDVVVYTIVNHVHELQNLNFSLTNSELQFTS